LLGGAERIDAARRGELRATVSENPVVKEKKVEFEELRERATARWFPKLAIREQ
jgi:hypothetical protein